MFAQWAAMGPWMQQPSSAPQGNGIQSVQPAWKLKVIRCLDRKLKAFQPSYAPEGQDEDNGDDGWKVPMTRGTIKKTKKGKASVRSTKQDFSADGSYGRWIASGEHVKVEKEMGLGPTKKFTSWVRPGVLLVRARPPCRVKQLIRDDLPTLERPAKATSGIASSGGSPVTPIAPAKRQAPPVIRFSRGARFSVPA